jgi:hypothetical protein
VNERVKIDKSMIDINRKDREEHFYHLPSISLTEYLCSIGGIIAMWIGISIWSQVETIGRILRNKYREKYSKNLKKIRRLALLICIILSSVQIISTLQQYFSYEYLIRISSQVRFNFPSFQFFIIVDSKDSKSTLISQFNEINKREREKYCLQNL